MSLLVTILLIGIGIIVTLGIIRILLTPRQNFTDILMDMFFLDILTDIIQTIFESFDD